MADLSFIWKNDEALAAKAVEALAKSTGLLAEPVIYPTFHVDNFDGELTLKYDDQAHRFAIECKERFDRTGQISHIKSMFDRRDRPALLITPYVSREMATGCRAAGLHFIDTHGNAFLEAPGIFVYSVGERSRDETQLARPERGTNSVGRLRVSLAILTNPSLINSKFQELADIARVSLGTVNNALAGFEKRGFIVNKSDAEKRRLLEPERLLEEWTVNYPTALKPKFHRHRFDAADPNWWQDLAPDHEEFSWGGEVGAAEISRSLRPETQTIYVAAAALSQFTTRIAQTYRLKANPNGKIEILERFWDSSLEPAPGIAPAPLIYSELCAILDPRAREAAATIKELWIDPQEN